MKTFGFNMMQEMGADVQVNGSYDPEQQVWVGEVGSSAFATYIPFLNRTFDDGGGGGGGGGGSTISTSSNTASCTNGQCTSDSSNDDRTD